MSVKSLPFFNELPLAKQLTLQFWYSSTSWRPLLYIMAILFTADSFCSLRCFVTFENINLTTLTIISCIRLFTHECVETLHPFQITFYKHIAKARNSSQRQIMVPIWLSYAWKWVGCKQYLILMHDVCLASVCGPSSNHLSPCSPRTPSNPPPPLHHPSLILLCPSCIESR